MNILTLDQITKSYGERKLFDKASFYLQEGEKVGIIGVNGTGKSTLLRIMAGLETPDEGERILANHVVLRMLPQNPVFDEKDTVLESVLKSVRTQENEWSIETDAKTMLMELEITDFSQPVGELSGGQRKRLALVRALLLPSDILILDEPTNHLDTEMSEWLEETLKKRRGAVVLVTHDRYFLDSVTDHIVEIDKGQMYRYDTNYAGFLERKAEREEMAIVQDKKRRSLLRTELEWVRRGAQARTTKQKARLERFEELKNARGPESAKTIEIGSVASRMGRTTLELHSAGMNYGDRWLFRGFTYIFLKKDRIGFIGKNGCGKTTLMKILCGRIIPSEGEVVTGETVKIGYYSQEIETDPSAGIAYMDPQKRVIDYIRDTAEYVRTPDGSVSASQMLDNFLFPPNEQYARIEKLSGGEKRRLNLLRVLMEAPNVLILDEPTNDLDITTLTILEDYLDRFDGIVIMVSHDRYFLDRMAQRIFSFEDGKICQYEGGYTDYLWKRREKEGVSVLSSSNGKMPVSGKNQGAERTSAMNSGSAADQLAGVERAAARSSSHQGEKKLRFTYQEQKDFDTIEEQMASLEERLSQIEKEMNESAADYTKLGTLMKEKEEKEALLDEKMERWMYLEELNQKIQEQNR